MLVGKLVACSVAYADIYLDPDTSLSDGGLIFSVQAVVGTELATSRKVQRGCFHISECADDPGDSGMLFCVEAGPYAAEDDGLMSRIHRCAEHGHEDAGMVRYQQTRA